MGYAARRQLTEQDLIEQEKIQYPELYGKVYRIKLQKKHIELCQEVGIEFETLIIGGNDIQAICERAEKFQAGATKLIMQSVMK